MPGLNRIAETTTLDSSIGSRLEYSKLSLRAFSSDMTAKKTLFGSGWDNYLFVWNKYYDQKIYALDSANADRAHNKLFDMLIMTGVLGLLAYLSAWFFFMKKVRTIFSTSIFVGFALLMWGIAYFVNLLSAFDTIATFSVFYAVCSYVTTYSYE